MATVSLTLSAVLDGIQQTVTRSATIDDAAMPYFFQAYGAVTPQVDNGDGTFRNPTEEEIFQNYAVGIMNGSVSNVQRYVADQAAEAAKQNIPTITATPQ